MGIIEFPNSPYKPRNVSTFTILAIFAEYRIWANLLCTRRKKKIFTGKSSRFSLVRTTEIVEINRIKNINNDENESKAPLGYLAYRHPENFETYFQWNEFVYLVAHACWHEGLLEIKKSSKKKIKRNKGLRTPINLCIFILASYGGKNVRERWRGPWVVDRTLADRLCSYFLPPSPSLSCYQSTF